MSFLRAVAGCSSRRLVSSMAFASGAPSSPNSAIWQAALEKYYRELEKGGISATTIDKEVWNVQSPEDLLAQIEQLRPPQSSTWTTGIKQLQPVLISLSDFAEFAAWGLGNNGKVATVLWGSLRLVAKVSAPWSMQTSPIKGLTGTTVCEASFPRCSRGNPRPSTSLAAETPIRRGTAYDGVFGKGAF